MTVGKCSDFAHPPGFGFTGSAGKTPVRNHMRGGPVARSHKGDPAPSSGKARQQHATGKGGAHTFARGGEVGVGAFGDNSPKHPKVRAAAKAKPDAADRDDEAAEVQDKARGGQLSDAFKPSHKGRLHKALGVPEGKKISADKMEKAEHSKNPHVRRMAQAAENMETARRAKGGRMTKPMFGKRFGD